MEPEVEEEELDPLRPNWMAWFDGSRAGAGAPTYWLTRFLILRLLGFVYLFAFSSLAVQVLPLIGEHGLLPANDYLERVAAHFGSRASGFYNAPSLFWLYSSDPVLVALAWIGAALSLLVALGLTNAVVMVLLWALYMSFVHIGQLWYGYGWEIQLLETGFLAIFLCPIAEWRPFPRRPPPFAVIMLFRWLVFRIMIGAGLIKIRGDTCWRDLTCLYYHYETQPIPNPLSRVLHFMPHWFHKAGALFNHLVELVAPWFAFGPTRARHIAGLLFASFQVILILSGNLSFLNWLTLVPILACFDDSIVGRVVPGKLRRAADRARADAADLPRSRARETVIGGLVFVVVALSINPILNLMSDRQIMDTSFDPLELVNTYGAFGTVGRDRDEIIFEGTSDETITDQSVWKAYEFPCKPGALERRPCLIGAFHRRLDWQIWFAAMESVDEAPWTLHLIWKLLHNDRETIGLLGNDPFPDKPPRWIRAELYRYRFAPLDDGSGAWWRRTRVGPWLPPLSADMPELRDALSRFGWVEESEREEE